MFLNKVYWLTGYHLSGKTTIAHETKKVLKERFFNKVVVLDDNDLKLGINNDFADVSEHIRRTAEIARLYIKENYIVFCTSILPTIELAQKAKSIIGSSHFVEVFIDCPLHVCKSRDTKEFYKKNINGAENYEKPILPDLVINTELLTVRESITKLYIKIVNG